MCITDILNKNTSTTYQSSYYVIVTHSQGEVRPPTSILSKYFTLTATSLKILNAKKLFQKDNNNPPLFADLMNPLRENNNYILDSCNNAGIDRACRRHSIMNYIIYIF
jgi:hypothetical protein